MAELIGKNDELKLNPQILTVGSGHGGNVERGIFEKQQLPIETT